MNQKLKQAGLFAILAVFTISMTTSFVGEADAIARDGIRHDNVVLPEPEADVSLSLKALQEPTMTKNVPLKGVKWNNPEQHDATPTFMTTYLVANDGSSEVMNIDILVKSDVETVSGKLLGKLDPKHATITVMIKALDADSISAKIVGFETPQDLSKTPN